MAHKARLEIQSGDVALEQRDVRLQGARDG